ncbi:MAG TPA: hypothetical protein DCE41_30240 [Cytophagales bacterium]|nr:hypothetical protein [Cytophagales bacterium]HAA20401.1 hypothetical protein [Cytophagales bacterium]HAP62124.1 hypothetical protein [Cytophagales bacterium]
MKGVENPIVKNIIQLAMIVFSVVLGIFLSERIEERKNEKEAALLLSKITLEVAENQRILEEWVPVHREVVKRLDSLYQDDAFISAFVADKSVLFKAIFTRSSLMGRTPAHDAWDIAKAHPLIVHFDYNDLLLLSKVYNQQIMTYSAIPELVDHLLSADFNAQDRAKENLGEFRNRLRETVSREMQLMEYFAEAESLLQTDSP